MLKNEISKQWTKLDKISDLVVEIVIYNVYSIWHFDNDRSSLVNTFFSE